VLQPETQNSSSESMAAAQADNASKVAVPVSDIEYAHPI